MYPSNRPHLNICVEGNIAAGKSTFMRKISELSSNVQLFPEPLIKWQLFDDSNLFQAYYKNGEKYALPFQLYAALTFLERQLYDLKVKPIRIYERSLLGSGNCFIKALQQTNKIDCVMANVLSKCYEFFNDQFDPQIDLIIYIKSSPFNCYQRIEQRGRSEERHISMAYLSILHTLYDNWINTQTKYKVHIIDGEKSACELQVEYERCVQIMNEMFSEKIRNYVSELV